MCAGRTELQEYMDSITPALNEALNTLARDRPADPLKALASMLANVAAAAPPAASGEFDLAAHEKAELEKKQADAAKKAKEKEELERLNAEKDAKLAAEGKRAAGGLHKFDPDEVDVHGGSATADDFMDAFGF